jgi:hypothetical protein
MRLWVRAASVLFAISSIAALSATVEATGADAAVQSHGYHGEQFGYWLVGSDGGVFTFGAAQFYGSTGSLHLQRPVVGIVTPTEHNGYWLVASDGGIFAYGSTQFYGSIPGLGLNPAGSGLPNSLNAPIVGVVPSSTNNGYFMVASDGGVFAFGDAKFEGSCPGIGGCSGSAVAVLPDVNGDGYWLVTSTGNVYAFGAAANYGQPGPQTSPITSAASYLNGAANGTTVGGYWILDANGQVFCYGNAVCSGSTADGQYGSVPAGQAGGSNPATAIFADSPLDGSYWVTTAQGKVFAFGGAPFEGDMSGTALNGHIIAAAGF